ncbi:hypothetical protein GOP47_0013391 [Adiantum capillus-veneris]|uniref:Uncharacterized protein n=1 Tax=Adiantum capillus-veneris TaxID=13818 RepID=A0A9D4ZF93_ADICA|nr:hypothetical protein GOP47_0013391 [Adiantum capillus-veneris]
MEFILLKLVISKVRQWKWSPTFYVLHATYFLALGSIGTLILFLSPENRSNSSPRYTFVDALYMATSALTNTGLTCASIESSRYLNKFLFLVLFILGSQMLVSYMPLHVKRLKYRSMILQIKESHPQDQISSNFGINKECNYCGKLLEYNALSLLSYVLVVYFLGLQIVGFLAIEEYLRKQCKLSAKLVEERTQASSTFFAYFSAVAAFSNSGLSLLDDSMVAFRKCNSVLLTHSALMMLGNTMLAPALRFILWLLYHLSRLNNTKDGHHTMMSSCDYLLKQPRRCYTHLFPHQETMWLVGITLGVNGLQLLLLCCLQWNSEAMFGTRLSSIHKLVNATFQSIATRTTGENVVNLPQISTTLRLLYLTLMYFSIYPVFLSRQRTNVSKESDHKIPTQALKLLLRDSTLLFLALLVICTLENHNLSMDPSNFSIFNVVFETVSAYGNVGLSMGYDCTLLSTTTSNCNQVPYSFSSKWTNSSKLVLVLLMLLGRQRGLPENIDSALQMNYLSGSSQDDQKLEVLSKSSIQTPSHHISSKGSQHNEKLRKSLSVSSFETSSTHISTPPTISYICSPISFGVISHFSPSRNSVQNTQSGASIL